MAEFLMAYDPAVLILCGAAIVLAAAVLFLAVQSGVRKRTGVLAAERLSELGKIAEDLRERLSSMERECTRATTVAEHLRPLQPRVQEAESTIAKLQADLRAREVAAHAERSEFERRAADLTTLRGEMEKDFKNLAAAALGESRQSFLTLADEVFKKHRVETSAEVEARRKAVEDLVRPIGETLQMTRSKLEEIEKERADAYGQIRQQLATVGTETARLTQALKANPGTRGRWAEESLRNALELAGLSSHCDFQMQVTFAQLDSSLRPDCVIRLPGERCIVVDAKAPITGYLEAIEATDEAGRAAGLKRHADSMRQHMLKLAKKEYAQAVSTHLSARPDFVAMYIPGENFFAAAVERNGHLFNESIENGVFIVTPTTLIALAKSIAIGWRQEAIAENFREVAALGRELYARLATMGDHVIRLGDGLERSVKTYNSFIGSLESSVLPQARKLKDLHITESAKIIDLIEPIETDVRRPTKGRDLLIEERPQLPLSAAE